MTSIKRDDHKQSWENTEFPLVCETCLGDNPYIRMTKEPYGKKCQICEVPFTVFGWQAGTKGRWKKVEICQSCAKTKNVCQVCIFDLQFGLPVKVRDKVIRESGGSSGAGNFAVVKPPQSDANLSWFTQSQNRAIEQQQNQNNRNQCLPVEAVMKLEQMARMEPRYERNLAKICTFFIRGECNRGNQCPFRHEMPKSDRNDPLSKQSTKDRFYGTKDPVAEKMIWRSKERAEKRRAEAMARDGLTPDAEAVSAAGADETTTILKTTVYCRFGAGVNGNSITEQDVRDKFYSYGEISSIRFPKDRQSVFIEYTSQSSSELAILAMDQKPLGGAPCYVSHARAPKRGNAINGGLTSSAGLYNVPIRPMAAPGASQNSSSSSSSGRNGSSSNGKKLSSSMVPLRPSAEVLEAAKRRRLLNSTTATTGGLSSTSMSLGKVGVPRPGGVVGAGAGLTKRGTGVPTVAPSRPYYPSQNPGRLGSRAAK